MTAPATAWEPPARSVPADAPIAGYTLAPDTAARAEARAHTHHLMYAVDALWSLVVLWLLLRLKVAPRLQRLGERVSRVRFVQICVFAPLFLLTLALGELPLTVWGHSVERKYGLSVQGWGSVARDWAVGQAIGVVLGTLCVWIVYAVMRRAPRRWWLWAWAVLAPLLLLVTFVTPLVIEPLFFKFSPLATRDAALAQQLHDISARAGAEIPVERMFVMDASEKLRSVNAYVTGFGASKRVVVWDTTLAAMNAREIAFVFGHELGHYVLHHVVFGIAAGLLGLLAVLWLAARSLGRMVARWGPGWHITRVDEPASLPLLLLVATLLGTVSTPVTSAFSRALEHSADAFGRQAVRGVVDDERQAAAHAFQRLGEIDLSEVDPSPLAVFWLYSHPPIRDRVTYVLTAGAP